MFPDVLLYLGYVSSTSRVSEVSCNMQLTNYKTTLERSYFVYTICLTSFPTYKELLRLQLGKRQWFKRPSFFIIFTQKAYSDPRKRRLLLL